MTGNETDFRTRAEAYLSMEDHPDFIAELERILETGDEAELEDRFYRDLEFGTGGLRGVIGAGFNRMNPSTVKRATLGLLRYIKTHVASAGKTEDGVVFAYDSRRYSREFAETAALACAAEGIKAYVFESLRPTPELSFAVRHLGALAGVVITASHNPPEYNGYKVYWSDGGQIVPPVDVGIIEEVRSIAGRVETISRDTAIERGLYEEIGENVDTAFLDVLEKYLLNNRCVAASRDAFSVVYTPLHGAGMGSVESILDRMGVRYTTVPEQRAPDGGFPTVDSPNPEESAALRMAIELAGKTSADLVLGTDPDADRMGAAVRDADGEYTLLSGNQIGSLLSDYIFSTRTDLGRMPPNPVLVKTIVTTELQRKIAESYGATVYDVLTGFKYIGEKMREFESTGESYVFGGEESFGYLVETEVRDKDSIGAVAMTVEMATWCATKGWTLLDYLDDIFTRFGCFDEILISKTFPGAEGAERIQSLVKRMRDDLPSSFGGERVLCVRDYLDGRIATEGVQRDDRIDLPRSNVLQFLFESGVFTVRPSGTEPKIKFYASCWEEPSPGLEAAKRRVAERIQAVREAIEAII